MTVCSTCLPSTGRYVCSSQAQPAAQTHQQAVCLLQHLRLLLCHEVVQAERHDYDIVVRGCTACVRQQVRVVEAGCCVRRRPVKTTAWESAALACAVSAGHSYIHFETGTTPILCQGSAPNVGCGWQNSLYALLHTQAPAAPDLQSVVYLLCHLRAAVLRPISTFSAHAGSALSLSLSES